MQHQRTLSVVIAASALFGLAACGDDPQPLTLANTTVAAGSDITLPGGGTVTLPGGGTATIPVVPGVPAECTALINAMMGAGALAAGQGDLSQAQATFEALVAAVPEDLKDDAAVFSAAYSQMIQVLMKYEGNFATAMADPEAVAAMEAIGTPEVQAAADNISAYMDATCPD
ncbi:MAG: hypothetical protein Q7V88_11220 [Actinomycetota bacterium]|nr:hypothetical protein [Actinomycetota bacterium]